MRKIAIFFIAILTCFGLLTISPVLATTAIPDREINDSGSVLIKYNIVGTKESGQVVLGYTKANPPADEFRWQSTGYDFFAKEYTTRFHPFYLGYDKGELKFWANNYGQSGVLKLSSSVASIPSISTSNGYYYKQGVPVNKGGWYVTYDPVHKKYIRFSVRKIYDTYMVPEIVPKPVHPWDLGEPCASLPYSRTIATLPASGQISEGRVSWCVGHVLEHESGVKLALLDAKDAYIRIDDGTIYTSDSIYYGKKSIDIRKGRTKIFTFNEQKVRVTYLGMDENVANIRVESFK